MPAKGGAIRNLCGQRQDTMSGSLNSVVTNTGAMIALESLDKTNSALNAVQKQVSTGYRVADATDDGAAYAVAQSVRSTVGALTTANQQLGSVQGLLSTTQSGLNDISNTMASMRDVLVKLVQTAACRATSGRSMKTQYSSLLANVQSFIEDANYNGKTLIGNITGSSGTFGAVAVVRNENAATYGIATFGGSELYGSIAFTTTQLNGASTVAALISATGTFLNQMNAVGARAERDRLLDQLREQPDQLQQRQDRFAEHRPWLAGGCRPGEGIGPAAVAADPAAAWHAGADPGQPGAADAAEPVQVIA